MFPIRQSYAVAFVIKSNRYLYVSVDFYDADISKYQKNKCTNVDKYIYSKYCDRILIKKQLNIDKFLYKKFHFFLNNLCNKYIINFFFILPT